VPVLGDALDEDDETYTVTLSSPTNATISDASGAGVITDDDPTPTLSINDVTVTEGDAGTVDASFTVTLSAASGRTVTVQYATANGTAVAPGDYTAIGTTQLTFTPGVTTQPVTVVVQGDQLDEADETLNVALSSPNNANITDGTGVGTITDDDANGLVLAHLDGTTSVAEAIGPNNVDSVSVVLAAEPLGDVVLDVTSADPGEFTVDPADAQLTFTSANWNVPQIVSILGVEDSVDDDDQVISLTVAVNDLLSHDAWDPVADATLPVTVVDVDN
jgi:hypothetical protein